MCPNFNCNAHFQYGQELLAHTISCPTCILCPDCKQTFTTYNDVSRHDCLANDELFVRKSLDKWYNQVRSGQLKCPNPSCASLFFMLDDFVNHTKICARKSKFAERVRSEDSLPCSFCYGNIKFADATKHMEEQHTEVNFLSCSIKTSTRFNVHLSQHFQPLFTPAEIVIRFLGKPRRTDIFNLFLF